MPASAKDAQRSNGYKKTHNIKQFIETFTDKQTIYREKFYFYSITK